MEDYLTNQIAMELCHGFYDQAEKVCHFRGYIHILQDVHALTSGIRFRYDRVVIEAGLRQRMCLLWKQCKVKEAHEVYEEYKELGPLGSPRLQFFYHILTARVQLERGEFTPSHESVRISVDSMEDFVQSFLHLFLSVEFVQLLGAVLFRQWQIASHEQKPALTAWFDKFICTLSKRWYSRLPWLECVVWRFQGMLLLMENRIDKVKFHVCTLTQGAGCVGMEARILCSREVSIPARTGS